MGGGALPAPGPNPGRAPGAPERVGWGPRRSPGRTGVRVTPCGGAPGRGRWKIGLPRSGIAPRAGAPLAAERGVALGGARYTGRGPVCGTIKRRGAAEPAPGCPERTGALVRTSPGKGGAGAPGCGGAVTPLDGGSEASVPASAAISHSPVSISGGATSASSSSATWSSIVGSEGLAASTTDGV